MNIGDLYNKVKFDEGRLNPEEYVWVRDHLLDPSSKRDWDTHLHILTFVRSNEPTPAKIAMIEPFLSNDTDDYVRQAAILGLVTFWEQDAYSDVILDVMSRMGDDDLWESGSAVRTAIFASIFRSHDKKLIGEVRKRFARYLKDYEAGSLSALDKAHFKDLIHGMVSSFCRYSEGRAVYCNADINECADIAKQLDDYIDPQWG